MALGESADPVRYARTERRTLTHRGLLWLGQTCNLRCHFCYFIDRITDPHHPEHRFMSLEKAKEICSILRYEYGNNAIDIQGGEPTLFPGIYDLVAHCRTIGLNPTLITNGQILGDVAVAQRFKDAGIRDFLVSVHGLGSVYDRVVGRSGAHARQMAALRSLREVGVPFRFNAVMSRLALPQLAEIARLGVETDAHAINYLAFNPYDDQVGRRSAENVAKYSEIAGPLEEAFRVCDRHGIEVNVRYLPFCIVDRSRFPSIYNFQQLSYDHHENDFNSWRWTGRQEQRTHDDDLTKRRHLGQRKWDGRIRRRLHGPRGVTRRLLDAKRDEDRLVHALYREDARRRAEQDLRYEHPEACKRCDLRSICDGFHRDYTSFFGSGEAQPVDVGKQIDDPISFIREQTKIVQKEDEEWAL
jgi:MoaA/NifB/PqqE/SkfB family radical SAM enzyme